MKYLQDEDPYDIETFLQVKKNLIDFWKYSSGIGSELSKVAIRIHRICVNSASVERLWSSMGFYYTDYQARLMVINFFFFFNSAVLPILFISILWVFLITNAYVYLQLSNLLQVLAHLVT